MKRIKRRARGDLTIEREDERNRQNIEENGMNRRAIEEKMVVEEERNRQIIGKNGMTRRAGIGKRMVDEEGRNGRQGNRAVERGTDR